MADFNTDRKFDTGATRSDDAGKLQYTRALSLEVLRRFAEYMRDHNTPIRREDNWKLGFDPNSFVESAFRHLMDWVDLHEGRQVLDLKGNPVDIQEALCGLLFNVQGYLHQLLISRENMRLIKEKINAK